MVCLRKVCLLVVSLLPGFVIAQGSAGGYGQGQGMGGGGFGGGGFGGAQLGDRVPEDKEARPDESDEGWESRTAILTPGDRVEFRISLQKGEVLMAGVKSDAFDPALSVENTEGKVLVKNDDRAEGDQAPFVSYRADQESTCILKVLSFRSVSGGKFVIKIRKFVPLDATLGSAVYEMAPDAKQELNRLVFRLPVKKGGYYELRKAEVVFSNDVRHGGLKRLIGPTGVEVNDFKAVPTGRDAPVFQALQDGNYYAEYFVDNGRRYRTEFFEVKSVKVSASSETPLEFSPGEIKIIEQEVKRNQIIRSAISGEGLSVTIQAPEDEKKHFNVARDGAWGDTASFLWLQPRLDDDNDVVRVYHADGLVRFGIRSNSDKIIRSSFKNTESLPAWDVKNPIKGSLSIGESRFFLIQSTKSALMRVAVTADTFQPRLDIFRLNGDIANSLSDRKRNRAGDDLYFPDADTFLVRMSCDGHGGSGSFEMRREELSPESYPLGTPQTLVLDGINFGLYEVNLEAGKRYELLTDNPPDLLRADLLDDDGQFLKSQGLRFDNTELQYFVPTRSGRHRLWLRGAAGTRHFKFGLHVQPKVGG